MGVTLSRCEDKPIKDGSPEWPDPYDPSRSNYTYFPPPFLAVAIGISLVRLEPGLSPDTVVPFSH